MNVALKNIVCNPNWNFQKVLLPVLDLIKIYYSTRCLFYVREMQDFKKHF
jgi:hypothetical protein